MRIFKIFGSLLDTTQLTAEKLNASAVEGLSWVDIGINESKKARVEAGMNEDQIKLLNEALEKLN